MPTKGKISIIISFYERLDHLRCCLDSLRFSHMPVDEIIIADDGSSEATVREVTRLMALSDMPIRHVWKPKEGFRLAATRNNGIRHATGDYLVFLDCDFVVLPDTLAVHARVAKPGRFLAGGCKYLSESQTGDLFSTTLTERRILDLDRRITGKNLKAEQRKFIKRTWLMRFRLASQRKQSLGGHFSVFRKDIETVNGYDENFVGWGGEDEDLGIRLVKAGIYCRPVIPKARVLHLWHPRALGGKGWREGPNIDYFRRKRIRPFCEKGLTRGGRPEK